MWYLYVCWYKVIASHLKEHIQSKYYGMRFLCEFWLKIFQSLKTRNKKSHNIIIEKTVVSEEKKALVEITEAEAACLEFKDRKEIFCFSITEIFEQAKITKASRLLPLTVFYNVRPSVRLWNFFIKPHKNLFWH